MPICPPCSTVFTAAASAPPKTAAPDAHAPASPDPMNTEASAAVPASAGPATARPLFRFSTSLPTLRNSCSSLALMTLRMPRISSSRSWVQPLFPAATEPRRLKLFDLLGCAARRRGHQRAGSTALGNFSSMPGSSGSG
ncbi:hypothetical protein VPH35_103578 [Triticum aestivum]